MTDKEELYLKLLHREQESLWGDLGLDLRSAANGYWSIGLESRVGRIIRLIKVIGPTDWGRIQIPLLNSGVYEEVLKKAGAWTSLREIDLSKHPYPYPPEWGMTLGKIRAMNEEEFIDE